jgi:nanoRNase/pAp phosphatase (c-di-AMP/oligoRNAs hydrolase)
MQQELTPKQQAVELIKQANHILLVAGKNPTDDQLSAMTALELILGRAGKQVSAIMTGQLPKSSQVLDTRRVSRDLSGIRDFIIRLDTSKVEVDKLRYDVNEGNLEVVISPFAGNFTAKDASFDYGAYKFDLVIVLGVSQIAKIDTILEQNPTIFDGIHLINIDSHRSNEQYGSVNYIEPQASSVCEMLVGIIESVAQGMIDYHVATALLTGIMSGTEGFTAPNTTAKSLTIAAQMMSGGAKQQDIVKVLFSQEPKTAQPQLVAAKTTKPSSEKAETIAEKLAKKGVELTQGGVVDSQTGEAVAQEAETATQSEVEQSPKKFKNHSQKQ